MCQMGMGMVSRLIPSMVVMALGYFVLIAANKEQKGLLKTLGIVIGVGIILVTGAMFLQDAAKKCAMMNKSCPMVTMQK